MKQTGAEILLAGLKNEGVKYIFGNPGTTEVAILDALVETPEIEYILTLHESVAAGMADGFARAGGGVGFVNVHTALGLTNAIGNLYNAYNDETPVVLTIANKDSRILGRDVFSEVKDITGMTRQFTKWSWQVLRPELIAENIARAFKIATTPPTGPVFLSIPEDFLSQHITIKMLPSRQFTTQPKSCASPEDLHRAVTLLLNSKNPVMIAGTEVARAQALREAVELAELLGLTVLTEGRQSLSSLNFPSSHPLFRGGFDPQSKYLQNCDLIFAVGCDIIVQTAYSNAHDILQTLKTIHLHSNPEKIGKRYPVEVPILSDAQKGLKHIIELSRQRIAKGTKLQIGERFQRLKKEWEEIETSKQKQIQARWDNTPITVQRLVMELGSVAMPEAIIADEAIRSSRSLLNHYPFTRPGTYFRSTGGYLGWGLPASLGIKLALPDRQVIAFVGDGGFIMSAQALWTAARYHIPVTVIVCNNREYKAVKDATVRFKGRSVEKNRFIGSSIDNPAPDLAQLSKSFGISAATVTDPSDIKPALEAALNSGKPSVVDVLIER